MSILLNGGGLGQLQEINQAFAKALAGRENDMRSLLTQLDTFIIAAQRADRRHHRRHRTSQRVGRASRGEGSDRRQGAHHDPAGDVRAADSRTKLADAIDALGKFSAIATSTVNQTKESLVDNLRNIAPVLRELANAGPALTKGLDFLSTYPWVKSTVANWFRGDFANITLVIDLTLSRLDAACSPGRGGKATSPNSSCSGAARSARCQARTRRATR